MNSPRRHTLQHLVLACAALAMLAPAAPALAVGDGWFGGTRVAGNGNIKKQARDVGHFDGVSMGLSGNVELRTGSAEGITIETDDNLLPLIETVVDNGMLKIRALKRNTNLDTRTMKFVVTARQVNHLALGGSGDINADALRGGKLQIELGGSGTINVKAIEGDSLAVSLGGSGDLTAAGGSVKDLSVSIGGSGNVNLAGVRSGATSVNIAGSGQATVGARDALSVNIAGSGDVNYYGDPKVSKTVIGSGNINRKGGAR
jgi:hypothetical protein